MSFKRATEAQITLTVHKTGNRKASHACDNMTAAKRLAKRYKSDDGCVKITATGGELVGTHLLYGSME